MDEIKLQIKGKEHDTYTIHYSCDGFYNGGAYAPAICTISLINYATKELHSFALNNYLVQGKSLIESEQLMLKDFVGFYQNLNNPIFVHWNMDGLEYGFNAIRARAENFGMYDFDLTKIKDYNLSTVFHTNLMTSLEQNNCKRVTVLNGKDEAICFNKRAFEIVKMSTDGKAIGLSDLFEKYLSNDLADDDEDYIY